MPITTAADDRYCDFRELMLIFHVTSNIKPYMRGSRKFCQSGSNSDTVFFFLGGGGGGGGGEGSNTTLSGPSSAPV